MEKTSLSQAADRIASPFHAWFERVDQETLLVTLSVTLAVILLRRPLGAGLARGVRWLLNSISISVAEELETEIEKFMRILLVAGSLLASLDALAPPDVAGGFFRQILTSVVVLAIFAAWYRLTEPMIALIGHNKLTDIPLDTSWVVRIAQFVVVLMAITALLAVWNIDISSALTGVGVLGAGLAIAAQDFVRNLFAGMNNMSERRFETGDWIAVEGIVEGTVSRVDVRSTTVMGFDHVPHYVPNSELSNSVVLNKSRMDHRRILWTIGLVLDSTDAQVESVCDAVRNHMRDSGDFVTEESVPLIVCPVGLSDSSIDIQILGFTKTKDYQPFLEVCGRLVSVLRRALNTAGTDLAYPTQTIQFTSVAQGDNADALLSSKMTSEVPE